MAYVDTLFNPNRNRPVKIMDKAAVDEAKSLVLAQSDAAIAFEITGTYSGTVVPEECATADGTFTRAYAYPTSGGVPVNSITGTGVWVVPKKLGFFRLRVDAYTSGTISARAVILAQDEVPTVPINLIPLPVTSEDLALLDGQDLSIGTVTGSKIGTSATAKIGLWGADPVVQQDALTAEDATAANSGDSDTDAVIENIRTRVGEIETILVTIGAAAAS